MNKKKEGMSWHHVPDSVVSAIPHREGVPLILEQRLCVQWHVGVPEFGALLIAIPDKSGS
jgi:hypothetical protein